VADRGSEVLTLVQEQLQLNNDIRTASVSYQGSEHEEQYRIFVSDGDQSQEFHLMVSAEDPVKIPEYGVWPYE
jgi:hypothetical protein